MAFLAFAALIGVALYTTHARRTSKWARTALALILGGAAGNLVDRARQGYVVDFVDAYWGVALLGVQCGGRRHQRRRKHPDTRRAR